MWEAFCAGFSFNTQPPEGGWESAQAKAAPACTRFNTQPPEGGWSLS